MSGRLELIKHALQQRAECDEEFGKGWCLRWFGGWELGPYLPRAWRWAVALKCCICVLLGWEWSDDWRVDSIEIAAWDGERHNGYPEADFHEWSFLKVRKGWAMRSWYYATGREST